jgi:release factor glutamine methyltransferase
MKINEALARGTDFLTRHHIEDARLEAEILLCHALNLPRAALIAKDQTIIAPKRQMEYESFLHRRANHEPTAYIVGYQPFMGLDFMVNNNVLIPRPETELLFEAAVNTPAQNIVDLGTGSGCIAIALAKYLPQVKVIGIDHSKEAIKIALNNARRHAVENRCCFLQGNLFVPLKTPVDLIVSNPPYIPSDEIEKLQPEVKDWEPRLALDGGENGLKYIRRLIQESPQYLKPGGYLIFEFGLDQAKAIRKLADDYFKEIKIVKDYAGIDRIFVGN